MRIFSLIVKILFTIMLVVLIGMCVYGVFFPEFDLRSVLILWCIPSGLSLIKDTWYDH